MKLGFDALGVSLPESWSHLAVKRPQQVWETGFNEAPGKAKPGIGMGSDAAI
jgi:hypothetical protein